MNCKNCGAPLRSTAPVCDYCGSENEHYIRPIRYETYTRPIKSLCANVAVDRSFAENDQRGAIEFVIGEMSRKICDAIVPMVRVRRDYDPITMTYHFSGRLDVLDNL